MTEKLNFTNLAQIIGFISKKYQNPQAFNLLENGKWRQISTEEFSKKVKFLALALRKIGLKPNQTLAIISYPNPIWLMMDFAIISSGGISVPIFANIAPQNLEFEIKDAKIDFIFCDDLEALKHLKNYQFQKIITYNLKVQGENIIDFAELLKIGEELYNQDSQAFDVMIQNIKEDDLATIVYTSGSTGTPKGVEITHKNLVSQIKGAAERFPLDHQSDIALSFLPLAHIFERMVVSYYIAAGIKIYFADDVNNVGKIIKEIRPTLMTVVPRVLEKVYKKMRNDVDESGVLKKIIASSALNLALKSDVDKFKKSLIYKIFDGLVYKKLRQALGGRFRMIICGGAALSDEMNRFFTNIGLTLYIGYGLTESSPVIAANNYQFHKFGTIGKAFPEIEVKLSKDKELLARGPNIMRGYHNHPEKTAEVIDKEGWLNTGDLAEIDDSGYIKIIGRKKELFKTANGKYVSPIPIEQKILSKCGFLMAADVIAEGRKFTSCLLFADFDVLEKYKAKFKMTELTNDQFLNSSEIQEKIAGVINSINANLNHWEQIQKYYLVKDPISIESGEITPSMKLRRSVVEEKYREVIEGFYQE